MNDAEKLKLSLQTSFLNSDFESDEDLRSKLIINNYHKGTKVLSHLLSNLKSCDEFFFSVAFITTGGLVMLLDTLKELEVKGVKGKIITTNYLNFSDPRALKKLLDFKNIKVKVYDKDNFHTKGYIFKKGNHYDLIIGSSNLTQDALTKNQEWNLKISSLTHGEIAQNVLNEFNQLFVESTELTEEWIADYSQIYKRIKTLNAQVE
jgi:HKD family nuclease